MKLGKRRSLKFALAAIAVLTLVGFIAADIPYAFDTDVAEVNVRNIQSSGHTNQYPIQSYLLATFTNGWKALYFKQCNACGLMWQQIDSWQGNATPPAAVCAADCTVPGCTCGGGGCAIADPAMSLMTLAGDTQTLVRPRASALVARRVAEDGRSVVADEFRLANPLDRTRSLFAAAERSGAAADMQTVGTPGDTGSVLLVKHQAAHPLNPNFAPTPVVTLSAQSMKGDRSTEGQRGFAIVEFGASGKVLQTYALLDTGRVAPTSVRQGVAAAAQTRFKDERRHDHTVYWAYEVQGGVLRSVGDALITMPMCCVCPGYPMCY